MYRTERWYNEVKNHSLSTPIFIMSMNRSAAPLFSALNSAEKADVHLFIRSDPHQQNLYSQYVNQYNVVTLPDWISDAGETREFMLQYAKNHAFRNIFVLDDRVKSIRFLVPKQSKTGKMSLTAFPSQTIVDGLKVWEKILEIYPFTLSAPSHAGFSYYPENIDAPYVVNNGIIAAAININVEDVFKYNIHYQRLRDCGGDDFIFLLDVMKAGLPTCKITDIEYDEIPSDKINGGTHTNISRAADMEKRLEKLYAYLQTSYPSPHPYVYIRKTRGVPYPYIRWKYWQNYYSQHMVKNIT